MSHFAHFKHCGFHMQIDSNQDSKCPQSRSQWPRGLRRRSAATHLLSLWVRFPAGVWMDVCLLWLLCVVRYRSLRRADHSSRGVLPTVVRRWVWSRNLMNEGTLAHWGLLGQKKKYPQSETHPTHSCNHNNQETLATLVTEVIMVAKLLIVATTLAARKWMVTLVI